MLSTSVVLTLLLLLCAGVLALVLVYFWSVYYLAKHHAGNSATTGQSGAAAAKVRKGMGLSAAQLEKLPKITGEDLEMGNIDCAVCLDDIESDQPVRQVPGCNHAFHLQCVDAWLSENPICPLCRSKVVIELPHLFAQTIIYGIIVYGMIGFEWTTAKFLWFLFFMYFTLYGMMSVAVTPNHNIASIISTAFYGIWNLFSGFLIPKTRIPAWLRWYSYICPVLLSNCFTAWRC